jgi:hypothetical protein
LENEPLRNRLVTAAARKVADEHSWLNLETRVFKIYDSLSDPQAVRAPV